MSYASFLGGSWWLTKILNTMVFIILRTFEMAPCLDPEFEWIHCRKPTSSTGKGMYELKPECYKEYNPFFYHYTRAEQSKVKLFLSVLAFSYLLVWGAVVASGLGCWTQDSRVMGSIPTLGMVRFWSLGNFIYPPFASVYSAANEYQHCWGGTCDELASCPGESVLLHSNCLR